ncbi:MAG TPA: hypothetical protein VIP70_05515 [Nitrososphaeraceae archaeon]
MLNDCFKYAMAINAKGQPFPTEPLIMALLLSQHKLIDWITKQVLTMEIRKVQVSDLKNLLIYILFQVPSP